MKKINKYYALALSLILIGGCTYDFPEPQAQTSGEANFSKMISVGNSLTAGFMNAALYTAGQDASFAAILAKQMQAVGGGEFNQPTVNSINGCSNPTGGCTAGRLYLRNTSAGPLPTPRVPGDISALAPFPGKATLNNFGVPGVTLLTALIPATGGPAGNPAYNPYYARIASSPSTNGATGSSLIGDAAAALANGGTFFTFWLGNNDVLGYATGGASDEAVLTSNADFATRFDQALGLMLAANADAKGAVANIADITSIPFFSTVVYNPVTLPSGNAAALGAGFAGYNQVINALKGAPFNYPAQDVDARKVSFTAGAGNKLVIIDETLNNYKDEFDMLQGAGVITAEQRAALVPYEQIRQTTASDLITLTAGSVIGTTVGGDPLKVNGLSVPLGDQYVLIPSEITKIQASVEAFNTTIAAAVSSNSARLVLVDANALLKSLKTTATTVGGSAITASITPPFGAFSLDGVHPNARGMAFVANEFIRTINAKFGSNIPLSNPNEYAGNELPQ